MNEGPGVKGVKGSEWVNASDAGVRAVDGELPDGVRFYIKGKAVDIPSQKVKVMLYLMVDDGGTKDKKINVDSLTHIPEDDEIGERHGPGEYSFIAKWTGLDGKPTGMMSDRIYIGEAWRQKHEDYKRRAAEQRRGAFPVPEQSAAPAPVHQVDAMNAAMGQMENMFTIMDRFAAIAQKMQGPSAGAIIEQAYTGAGKIMDKAMTGMLDNMRAASDRVRAVELDEEDEKPAPAAAPEKKDGDLPDWLIPFMPHLKAGFEKLLGGGAVGAATKVLLTSTDEFKAVIRDPVKWSQATEALKAEFGEEKTERALKVLLSTRPEKVKPAAKVVAKKNGRK